MSSLRVRFTVAGMVALLALAVVVVGSGIHMSQTRVQGDLRSAEDAIGSLFVIRYRVVLEGDSVALSQEMKEAGGAIDVFMLSDGADRLPVVSRHVGDAWLAFETADQLWRAHDEGITRVPFKYLHDADAVRAAFPALSESTVTEDGVEYVDNAGLRAVALLFDQAAVEERAARDAYDASLSR